MKCPACGNNLEEVAIEGTRFDICKNGCGGIWFDRFELKKVDEPQEGAGKKLIELCDGANVKVDHQTRRHCPKCENIVMMRHFFSVKKDVEVDECPNCAGFWLDYGELGKIRTQFNSEEERDKAAEEYFSEIFGVELAKMKLASDEKERKAKKIANMFKFICPSYYIPGKQDWGNF
jgi:uncharacterized protein